MLIVLFDDFSVLYDNRCVLSCLSLFLLITSSLPSVATLATNASSIDSSIICDGAILSLSRNDKSRRITPRANFRSPHTAVFCSISYFVVIFFLL